MTSTLILRSSIEDGIEYLRVRQHDLEGRPVSYRRAQYAMGRVEPHYPVPAVIPTRDFSTYEGTWGKPISDALDFYCAIGGSGGINWTWAYFATKNDAIGFDEWCEWNYLETRGVYPPFNGVMWGVRYR